MNKAQLKQLIKEVINELDLPKDAYNDQVFRDLHQWILNTFKGKKIQNGQSVLDPKYLVYKPQRTEKYKRFTYSPKRAINLDLFGIYGLDYVLMEDGTIVQHIGDTKMKVTIDQIKKKILDDVKGLQSMSAEDYDDACYSL